MKIIEECDGYKSLLASIKKDADEGQGCFNPAGCDHEYTRTVPQENEALKKMGMETACMRVSKCFHKYCDKFAWVISRAKHYAEKTGLEAADILDAWERDRSYWYMNYYQDSNQPEIKGSDVRVFGTVEELRAAVGNDGFRCPLCGGVSKSPSACDTGIIVEGIKDGKDGPCNWKSYGLFRTLGKGATVFVKEKIASQDIFMPIAWEVKS